MKLPCLANCYGSVLISWVWDVATLGVAFVLYLFDGMVHVISTTGLWHLVRRGSESWLSTNDR